ncbi:MAG: AmmeMemoRadiSam system protein A [Planctomycetota bacterium]
MDELGRLPDAAREAIRARLEDRDPRDFAPLARRAPVFVTLRIEGELRGCMGALRARFDDLVRETMDRALAAAFQDPRFEPLAAHELDFCSVEVTVLGELEATTREQLDPARYGVEVSDEQGRSAVLLPGIAGIETVERQLTLVRNKAGIAERSDITIRRFEAFTVGD